MSVNFDFLPRMLAETYNVFGDRVKFKVVSELEEQQVLFVEDGNHGEYRPLADEFVERGIPFVRPPNLKDGRIDLDACQQINDVAFKRVRKGIGKGGDIVLTHNATIGRVAKTRDTDPTFVTNPQTTVWRALDREVIDPYYLYYFMRSSGFQEQLEAHKGRNATFDYVSLTKQRSLVLPILDINLQRRIGSYLSCIDEKIFLNTKTNQTLEDIAQAIFKSWFVDFDPVKAKMNGEQPEGMDAATASLFPEKLVESELGLIPEGWDIKPLEDICSTITDGAHKSPKSIDCGGYPMASVKDMDEFSFNLDKCRRISESDYQSLVSSKCRPEIGDVLIAKDGSYLKHIFVLKEAVDVALLSSIAIARPSNIISSNYICLTLKQSNTKYRLENIVSGAVIQRIVLKDFRKFKVLYPSVEVLECFEEKISSIYQLIHQNLNNSYTLTKLRDTLLPKLLSGEIELGTSEELVEAI